MEEKNICYFLKMSGWVQNAKRKEFEQTVRFVFNQLPSECLQRDLTIDGATGDQYLFNTLWLSQNSLLKFMESEEFILIKGAYSALGALNKVEQGVAEQQTPDSNFLNNKN
jgi:hypothetical protein